MLNSILQLIKYYLSEIKQDKNLKPKKCQKTGSIKSPQWYIKYSFLLSYTTLIVFGYIRNFLSYFGLEKNKAFIEANRNGYVPLYDNWSNYFRIYLYSRMRDVFNQLICSIPEGIVHVVERKSDDFNRTYRNTGKIHEAINLGSYNYLGYAQNSGPISDSVSKCIYDYGVGMATTQHEIGVLDKHVELENLFAKFMGVESCAIFGMGFATNSTNIPTLCGNGCLIIGDQLNHASLKLGSLTSGSVYRTFRHNNMNDLEKKLRDAIICGEPITKTKWEKIIVIVEGIYSMEGTIANLPELIRLKKKYNFYLYVDEAHSICAIGQNGKGICDYYNCDPNDVDILMGTFTKSFSASGGYIAGKSETIRHIRCLTHSSYATYISPPIVHQISSVLKELMGIENGCEGRLRIERLARNTAYFRRKLKQMGFIVFGHKDSPVVPMMLSIPATLPAFVRMGVKKGIATVGAGYPATTISTSRMRFCMSSAHNKQMLDKALAVISEIGDLLAIKYDINGIENSDNIEY